MKYELTEEFIEVGDIKLYRIRALRDFGSITRGSLGGFIEKEDNLSHEGNAWVCGDAWVYGNARIFEDSWSVSALYIQGTAHSVTHCAKNKISIGCEMHDINYWKENYEKIGNENNYTKDQINKYYKYILLVEAIAIDRQ